MRNLNFRDFKKRTLVLKFEIEKIRIKSLLCNIKLAQALRFIYFQKWFSYSKNTSYVRVKNRCNFTSKSQSVYRYFRLNRVSIREFMSQGFLNGIRKSSW